MVSRFRQSASFFSRGSISSPQDVRTIEVFWLTACPGWRFAKNRAPAALQTFGRCTNRASAPRLHVVPVRCRCNEKERHERYSRNHMRASGFVHYRTKVFPCGGYGCDGQPSKRIGRFPKTGRGVFPLGAAGAVWCQRLGMVNDGPVLARARATGRAKRAGLRVVADHHHPAAIRDIKIDARQRKQRTGSTLTHAPRSSRRARPLNWYPCTLSFGARHHGGRANAAHPCVAILTPRIPNDGPRPLCNNAILER